MNLCVLGCSAIYVGKLNRSLFERDAEHAWSDKVSVVNIHINECNGFHHTFNITKLSPSLVSNVIVYEIQDPRVPCINLVQMNTRIIDHHKNWNVLLFKKAIPIIENKPILSAALKASNK